MLTGRMSRVTVRSLFLVAAVSAALPARGDGPADNVPDKVRRIPKPGIEVPEETRGALRAELNALAKTVEELRRRDDPATNSLLPDVEIYWRAVHDALEYREFFDERELKVAQELLAEGKERARELAGDGARWPSRTGLLVRGYVSKIDGSVQPYGLVVPDSYDARSGRKYRLDVWLHGRGETLSEVNFLNDRRKNVGTFAPLDTIVLHPYGRYCNANKFAGEVDVLEAIAKVRRQYNIDGDRIAVRGFSMGGASAWHLAAHYPSLWAAANPGAGFSETPRFLKVFQQETLRPTWWERKLWHLYDAPDWCGNLYHCPTVAYSGELDTQKQAADVMAEALRETGIELVHIIGPETKHSYHPAARDDVDRRITQLVARGREELPLTVHFTTWTLRYNKVAWLTVDALDEHWRKATVDGGIYRDGQIYLVVDKVSALTISIPPGQWPFPGPERPEIMITDGETVHELGRPNVLRRSDGSWEVSLHRGEDGWAVGPPPGDGLRKSHALQGPIDDAFMDSFLFVRPTGQCRSEAVEAWTRAELDRAVEHWRRHFRGHARVKDDTAITDEDIASSHLVLWGDAAANALLARIADRLPIREEEGQIVAGERRFAADHHVPILIHPNPLDPRRYVVLNSSFTFRDYAYLNNARQVPMLPDWAIIDIHAPPDTIRPGKVVDADFFDEGWRLKPPHDE